MKNVAAVAFLFLAGCSSLPDHPNTAFRSDVLYIQNSARGQTVAQQVRDLYGGRQEVVIVDFELPKERHPVPLSMPPPLYPYEMSRSGIEGAVTVDFIVDEAGRVIDAAVVETTNEAFNVEALKAVRKWRFKPASRNDMNVRAELRLPLYFTLGK